jgi:hypothetical protein
MAPISCRANQIPLCLELRAERGIARQSKHLELPIGTTRFDHATTVPVELA